ncbi:MAG: diaminopimelate epimerase [Chloroflexi bacterium]|nr:diaminopimelate epimerase [Chloroflexota bacterium]
MKFTKMQGAGNDFVVVETSDTRRDWAKTAIAVCDRHFGIGADGLLLVMPSEVADFRMRIFNADGSEAAACGNGIRCLVKYFVDNRLGKQENHTVSVETMAGVRKAEFFKVAGKVAKVKIGMGEPRFEAKEVPVIMGQNEGPIVDIKSMMDYPISVNGLKLRLNLVSMGNPHAVYFLQEQVAHFPLSNIGPRVEQNRIFPKGVNFEIVQVVNRQQIDARVWEHGVGETLACGSGACAIAVAAQLRGYADDKVQIRLPGGELEIEWDGAGEVFLTGPAETVFTGEWLEKN